MLSVIIPVYNVEQYLDKCMESVVNQTYRDLEIVLINDGSTDGSPAICRRYAAQDSRIVYIDKGNEGTGKTRNLGIQLCRGEYLTFLDSDDWWGPAYAELMMKAAEKAEMAVCDIYYVDLDAEGRPQEQRSSIRLKPWSAFQVSENPDLINIARTFLWGKIFKRSLFIDNHISQPFMAINDIPIVPLLVAKAGSICRVDEPLYYYFRGREGNTVTNFNALFSIEAALTALRDNFIGSSLESGFAGALHKMYYSQVRFAIRKGRLAVKNGQPEEDYLVLKEKMFRFLDENWKGHPDVEGKTFSSYGCAALREGIVRLLFDDTLLKENTEPVDIAVVEERLCGRIAVPNAGRTVPVAVNSELAGEDLYWNIADQILFSL